MGAVAVARVVEAACIGCTRCIAACPVDAIVGAAGRMHTVVAAWCTGCELCRPVCPTDCIDMEAGGVPALDAAAAGAREAARTARLAAPPRDRRQALLDVSGLGTAALRDEVLAAVARARARR